MTIFAIGYLLAGLQPLPDSLHRIPLAASKTDCPEHIAMKLIYLLLRNACPLVQIIHILSDDAVQLAQLIQFRQSIMGGVGLDIHQKLGGHHMPHFLTRFHAMEELPDSKIIRVVSLSQPTRAAEIRNARLCAHPGAGEHHQTFGGKDEGGKVVDTFKW